jgi:hypothetical protein
MRSAARFCLQLLTALLQGGLLVWVGCAPLVWIMRDGLGPDSHESGWGLALLKFAVGWGVPALALAVPLYGLWLVDRRLADARSVGKAGDPGSRGVGLRDTSRN